MREILFRGRQMVGGEWIEGSLLLDERGVPYIGTYIAQYPGGEYRLAARGCGKIMTRFVGIGFVMVDPATVGQYTGLKDKNGERIFEGDILKDDFGKIYKVIFTTKSCGFMVECTIAPNEYEKGRYRLGEAWCGTIEVIGNIHDNPELLGGGADA